MSVTKKDLNNLKSAILSVTKEDSNKLRSEFKEENSKLRSEFKADLNSSIGNLAKEMHDEFDKMAERLMRHFYTKGETDRKFDNVHGQIDKLKDEVSLLRQDYNTFRTTDFRQSLESIDFLHQKLDKVIEEPKATKLQVEVDELRARVIKVEHKLKTV
ncbi:MAG TPA: hypothetical protein VJL87_04690 [Bdellovibrionota bacterium]|nr:hypothetical protein [Bdellovibrionota bacterium]